MIYKIDAATAAASAGAKDTDPNAEIPMIRKGLPDYYAELNVDKNANQAQIRKAYRIQCLKWHPDKHPKEREEEVRKRFIRIGAAYETLSNAEKRSLYDKRCAASPGDEFWDELGEFFMEAAYETAEEMFKSAFSSIDAILNDLFAEKESHRESSQQRDRSRDGSRDRARDEKADEASFSSSSSSRDAGDDVSDIDRELEREEAELLRQMRKDREHEKEEDRADRHRQRQRRQQQQQQQQRRRRRRNNHHDSSSASPSPSKDTDEDSARHSSRNPGRGRDKEGRKGESGSDSGSGEDDFLDVMFGAVGDFLFGSGSESELAGKGAGEYKSDAEHAEELAAADRPGYARGVDGGESQTSRPSASGTRSRGDGSDRDGGDVYGRDIDMQDMRSLSEDEFDREANAIADEAMEVLASTRGVLRDSHDDVRAAKVSWQKQHKQEQQQEEQQQERSEEGEYGQGRQRGASTALANDYEHTNNETPLAPLSSSQQQHQQQLSKNDVCPASLQGPSIYEAFSRHVYTSRRNKSDTKIG